MARFDERGRPYHDDRQSQQDMNDNPMTREGYRGAGGSGYRDNDDGYGRDQWNRSGYQGAQRGYSDDPRGFQHPAFREGGGRSQYGGYQGGYPEDYAPTPRWQSQDVGAVYGGDGRVGGGAAQRGQPWNRTSQGQQGWRDYADAAGGGGQRGQRDWQDEPFDPEYSQWRDEQMRAFDDDYRSWRKDRYKKFSEDFSQWRSSQRQSGDQQQGNSVTGSIDSSNTESTPGRRGSGSSAATKDR